MQNQLFFGHLEKLVRLKYPYECRFALLEAHNFSIICQYIPIFLENLLENLLKLYDGNLSKTQNLSINFLLKYEYSD